eukprot:SAG31_NODE_9685_length_1241_cov_30.396673_1_plen_72_part_00
MEKYLVPGYPEFQVPLRYIEYAVFSFEQNLVQSSRYFNDIENTQYVLELHTVLHPTSGYWYMVGIGPCKFR